MFQKVRDFIFKEILSGLAGRILSPLLLVALFFFFPQTREPIVVVTKSISELLNQLSPPAQPDSTSFQAQLSKFDSVQLGYQISRLDLIKQNLANLSDFVDSQKEEITDYQQKLIELKYEKNSLEPLVKAHKEAVEALFRAQEERNNSTYYRDMVISFLLGIASSIVGSLLMNRFLKGVDGRNRSASVPAKT